MEDNETVVELTETIDTLTGIAKSLKDKRRKDALAIAVRHLKSLRSAINPMWPPS